MSLGSTSQAVIITGASALAAGAYYYYMARVSNPFKPSLIMRIVASYADDDEGTTTLSAYHGVHHLPLVKVKTLVEGIPDKVCSVKTFTFQLPDPAIVLANYIDLSLGDVIKMHCMGKLSHGGGHKNYSPTDVSTPGHIDLTVKIYPDGENSQIFDTLDIGDTVGMSGPWPPKRIRKQRLSGEFVNIVSFGVGITEGMEIVKGELKKEHAKLVTLLYATRYREDAFYKKELSRIEAEHRDRFRLVYVYSREPENSLIEGERIGRVDVGLLRDVFDLPKSPESSKHREQRFVIVGSGKMIRDTWTNLNTFEYNRDDHSLLLHKIKLFGKRKERRQSMYIEEENKQ